MGMSELWWYFVVTCFFTVISRQSNQMNLNDYLNDAMGKQTTKSSGKFRFIEKVDPASQ
jgi:hypothetical protein